MGNGQEVPRPAGESWDLEHWGQSLTLVNWCTMMCKQCLFMSSACVLSAASRICNGRNHKALPQLTHRGRHGLRVLSITCSTFCTVTFISRFCLQYACRRLL